jgi:hypothetical protein
MVKMINVAMDRDYFKQKGNPNAKKEAQYTECCGEDVDYDGLNTNNKSDWKLIEDHIENHLIEYSSVESVTPMSCEDCGRLLEYKAVIKDPKSKKGWYK